MQIRARSRGSSGVPPDRSRWSQWSRWSQQRKILELRPSVPRCEGDGCGRLWERSQVEWCPRKMVRRSIFSPRPTPETILRYVRNLLVLPCETNVFITEGILSLSGLYHIAPLATRTRKRRSLPGPAECKPRRPQHRGYRRRPR